MQKYIEPAKNTWNEILTRPAFSLEELDEKVKKILYHVKKNGDNALKNYTKQFDGVELDELWVSGEEVQAANSKISNELRESIDLARANIEKFHYAQQSKFEVIETSPGVRCWQKSVPIKKVGLYIPGGLAPLFSSVLMLAIPAAIAGCEEIVLCTPPDKQGNIHPSILYAAGLVGVTRICKIGGAQAIAAMAYGTNSVPAVYKIFGPGNQFVTAAKQLVSREGVAIDLPAGPSEVLVVADDKSNVTYVASDLLSQAEHGADSQVILVANNENTVDETIAEVYSQLDKLPRKNLAKQSLQHSKAIALHSTRDIIDLINAYAPEHLIISSSNYQEISVNIENAGSVFLGPYTPESAGDYVSGTNHTLPTNGYARAYSGVNLDSFVKKITFQQISMQGLKNIGKAVEIMAEQEHLLAHKRAVSYRLNELK
jgi:histidinol dehydrogenase